MSNNDDIKNFIADQMKNLPTRDQVERLGVEIKDTADGLASLRTVVERLELEVTNDRRALPGRVDAIMKGKTRMPYDH